MPLFRCYDCGMIDNTALAPKYWERDYMGFDRLCTQCLTGKWHNSFERKSAIGMLVDQDGHLWSKDIVQKGMLPKGYRIIGEVEI